MSRRLLIVLAGLALVVVVLPTAAVGASAPEPQPEKLTVEKFDTTTPFPGIGATSDSTASSPDLEIQKPKRTGSNPLRRDPAAGDAVALTPGTGTPTSSGKKAKSNPALVWSTEGVNHRDSRLAFGGNQFSGEPADQGLCAGNGYVLETVNSALRVYDASTGAAVTDVVALNEFYGFPPAIDRSTFTFGPFTFDISCHYDPHSDRWFHLAVDLDQDPVSGAFNGKNYLDLAVSTTGDPTGSWDVYRIPGMNNGDEGTPNHGCGTTFTECFADFPHIGVDENGVYISTNEFPLFEDGFIGAQVYAISKAALVAGSPTIDAYLFNTGVDPWMVGPDQPGFTLWPALSAGTQFAGAQDGTQYFVSSNAVFDDDNGDSEEIIVWALSNTESLDSSSPSLRLTKTIVPSQRYAVPPPSVQKDGDIPFGTGFEGATEPGPIDTSDSRVLDVRYANGKLWAVLGTAAEVGGEQRAGVAWFILNPKVNAKGVSATMRMQGILALEGESLAYPTLGVTTSGRGVMGFTRVGEELHPSQGYASIDAVAGVGPVGMAAEGNAPQDGFTEYGGRPRWGDYGAAAVDGRAVYLAGQYIEQGPCSVAELIATDCGGTRSLFANWSTRVTKTTP